MIMCAVNKNASHGWNLTLVTRIYKVYPIVPLRNSWSNSDLEMDAWMCQIKQKNCAHLYLTMTTAEREAFFVWSQMAKGRSQSRRN